MLVFLVPIFLIAVVSWATSGYLIWFLPPKIEGALVLTNIGYTIFSATLTLSLTIGLLFYFLGKFFQPNVRGVATTSNLKRLLARSLRRGVFLSLSLTLLVTLNIFDLLNLLNAALVIGIFILAESYFSSR